jgi:hypothetical protein
MATHIFNCPTDDNSMLSFYEEVLELNMPSQTMSFEKRQTDTDWRKAFEWYNKNFRRGGIPLSMKCRPCYLTVSLRLHTYKNKITNGKQINKNE